MDGPVLVAMGTDGMKVPEHVKVADADVLEVDVSLDGMSMECVTEEACRKMKMRMNGVAAAMGSRTRMLGAIGCVFRKVMAC